MTKKVKEKIIPIVLWILLVAITGGFSIDQAITIREAIAINKEKILSLEEANRGLQELSDIVKRNNVILEMLKEDIHDRKMVK